MITSKQRAALRALANSEPTIFQVGKSGVTEAFVRQVDDALEARELVKIHVLENQLSTARELCGELAERVGAEPVQVIGSRFVLYRESRENKTIEI